MLVILNKQIKGSSVLALSEGTFSVSSEDFVVLRKHDFKCVQRQIPKWFKICTTIKI